MSDSAAWHVVALALQKAFTAAVESGDLAKIDAVHEIAQLDGATAGRLIERIASEDKNAEGVSYVTPFLLEVVGPRRCQPALRLATGRNREEWLRVVDRVRAGLTP